MLAPAFLRGWEPWRVAAVLVLVAVLVLRVVVRIQTKRKRTSSKQ